MQVTNVTSRASVSENCIHISSSDGAGDLVSPETKLLVAKLKSAVFMPLLFLVCSPTNVINMIVFYKQGLRHRVNLCLFSLALVDLTVVFYHFAIFAEHMFSFNSQEIIGLVDNFLTNNKIRIFYSTSYGSLLLSTIIAIERCFCVMMPLHASLLLTTRNMVVIILTSVPIVCFLRLVVLAKYTIRCVYDERTQLILRMLFVTDYAARNKELLDFIDGIFYGCFMALGCPLIVLMCTLITIGKLWQTAAWRNHTSSADTGRERAVTKMLVTLSLVSLVLNLPRIGLRIYPMFNSKFSSNGTYRNLYLVCSSIAEICVCVESSFRFIIYYSASSKYRETLKNLIKTRCCLKRVLYETKYKTSSDDTSKRVF